MVTTKLNEIVNELLKKFTGGETYFDKLDDAIKDPENFDIVQGLFEHIRNSHVIMSGGFGYYVQGLFEKGLIPLKSLVVVNGSLRKGEIKTMSADFMEPNTEYVFVDDSFYKGRTRDKVKDFVETSGCTMSSTMVIYDGSLEKDDTVFSLYRYHK